MKLFGLGPSAALAGRVAATLDIGVAQHEARDFEDTEFKLRPLESVRHEHVFVIQSLYADDAHSASDQLVRLLFFIGALKDAGADKVTAVVPYLGFARKDRRTKARDPVSIRYVAQMFEAVGCDAIAVADVHNIAAFENAFRCVKEHVTLAPVIADHFAPAIEQVEKLVVVSPDSGGMKRAKAFISILSERFDTPIGLGFMEKSRSEGVVAGELFAGDVSGATVIVVDDLISTGTTMLRAAVACRAGGAAHVHVAATHGVFGEGAGDNLALPELDSVVVTDTTGDVERRAAGFEEKLVVLSCAEALANVIARLARCRGSS